MLGGDRISHSAVEFEHDLHDKPLNLLHEKIRRRDGKSHNTIEYTIVDCGTSTLNGDYVVLEDEQGGRKQISTPEFYEIWETQF